MKLPNHWSQLFLSCAACLIAYFLSGTAAGQVFRSVTDTTDSGHVVTSEQCPHGRSADPVRRAGHPFDVAPWAVVTPNRHYAGYYVGGGAALGGDCRRPQQGTWGVDYVRLLFWKRVHLHWWNGRHDQGGQGAYKSNGPHILPGH